MTIRNLSAAERLALLELLEATAPRQAAQTLSRTEPVDRNGPLPLSFAQWRLWFLDQLGIVDPNQIQERLARARAAGVG